MPKQKLVAILCLSFIACSEDVREIPEQRTDATAEARRDATITSEDVGTSEPDANEVDSGMMSVDSGSTVEDAGEVADSGSETKDSGTETKDADIQDAFMLPDRGMMADKDAGQSRDSSVTAPDTGLNPPDSGVSQDAGTSGCNCRFSEYCEYNTRFSCGGFGTCMPKPNACIQIFDPVCGCDKNTYSNECEAHAAGQDVVHEGPCDCRALGCQNQNVCQACRTASGLSYVCLPPGAVC
ncbi:MAG: Kazal-type serine protease inhibitor family protein [Myxococcota bacterium]|nr:Kazal-type serine protease inhibitor family protein [Myxococcota bacterium]